MVTSDQDFSQVNYQMLDGVIKVVSHWYITLTRSLPCYTRRDIWHFDKEECRKHQLPTHWTVRRGAEEMKGKLAASCRWRWARPAWCELRAHHTDRWGGVELKVSLWMPDETRSQKRTKYHRFEPPHVSLSRHSSLSKFAADEWTARRQWPFCLLGNLSRVSSMFGTVGMCSGPAYFSPDCSLS